VEYGNDKVQGLDYAYTLQGWIKGINSTSLEAARDMGKDGWDDVNNSNKYVAKDAMSYSLNYFQGDYKAIDYMQWNDVLKRFEATTVNSQLQNARYDLFNGNISSMVTTLAKIDTIVPSGLANAPIVKPLGNAYKYDQLNRLMSSVAYDNINLGNNAWDASGQTVANMYANSFTYDANGNILTQNRRDSAGVEFDAMAYKYQYLNNNPSKLMRNRLYHVNDNTSYTSIKTDDIDDQAGFNSNPLSINVNNNYNYDAIGNLIKDSTEQISNIEWTVYGKIKRITRSTGSTKDNLNFDYDASGNRIAKHVYDSSNQWKKSTYYIRDAQGNVMSTYEHTTDNVAQTVSFKLQEQHLYGSSRIGMNLPDYEMVAAVVNADGTPMAHVLGKKQYEMSNHLGNVLTVVSDRKIPVDANSDLAIDYYLADVLSTSDYYPFGSVMAERAYTTANGYRYGFNGKESDNEVKGAGTQYDYGFRIYDPRLGKFLSVDPLTQSYPWYTPYQFAGNKPILAIDLDGLEEAIPKVQSGTDVQIKKTDDNTVKGKIISTVEFKFTIGVQATDKQFNAGITFEPVVFTVASYKVTTTYDVETGKTKTETEGEYPFDGNGLEIASEVSVNAVLYEVGVVQSFRTKENWEGFKKETLKREVKGLKGKTSEGKGASEMKTGLEVKLENTDNKSQKATISFKTTFKEAIVVGFEATVGVSAEITVTPNTTNTTKSTTVPVDTSIPTVIP
jgi:RHS repeat-associated protein